MPQNVTLMGPARRFRAIHRQNLQLPYAPVYPREY